MKRKIVRICGMIAALIMIISVMPKASAVTSASDYFWYIEAVAIPTSDGEFIVEFDVSTTKIMEEVGASAIYIYEQQSDGKYEVVETFTRYNTTGLIDTSAACAYGKVYYQGTPGVKYFATVVLYAKDSNGSESRYRDTNVITAPN